MVNQPKHITITLSCLGFVIMCMTIYMTSLTSNLEKTMDDGIDNVRKNHELVNRLKDDVMQFLNQHKAEIKSNDKLFNNSIALQNNGSNLNGEASSNVNRIDIRFKVVKENFKDNIEKQRSGNYNINNIEGSMKNNSNITQNKVSQSSTKIDNDRKLSLLHQNLTKINTNGTKGSSQKNSTNPVQQNELIVFNKSINSVQQNKLTKKQDVSSQVWQDMLSFLHMDAVGLCEDIFNAKSGSGYKENLYSYYDAVNKHDDYLRSIDMTRIQVDYGGHSSNYIEETYVMWALARLPFVRTICETGFNAGHSTLLWLTVNPQIKVYSFDNAGFPAARPMSDYMQKRFPGRLTITWGDSTKTLPQFISDHPDIKCDLMIVDGGHTYDVATQDISNFKKMARGPKNIIFMDNYPDKRFGNSLARAWEQFKRTGDILEIFQCHYKNFLQGFIFGRFIF